MCWSPRPSPTLKVPWQRITWEGDIEPSNMANMGSENKGTWASTIQIQIDTAWYSFVGRSKGSCFVHFYPGIHKPTKTCVVLTRGKYPLHWALQMDWSDGLVSSCKVRPPIVINPMNYIELLYSHSCITLYHIVSYYIMLYPVRASINHHQPCTNCMRAQKMWPWWCRPCLLGLGRRFLGGCQHSRGLVAVGQKRGRTAGLQWRSRESLGTLQITCFGRLQQRDDK